MTDDSKTGKVLVLIDDANLYYASKKVGWDIAYEKFYQWLHANFSVLDIYFFGGIISKKAFFDRHPKRTILDFRKEKESREDFFKFLRKMGYKVRPKEVASLYDSTEAAFKRKCNVDVEITITALDQLDHYDELILCSGDGDFEKLLRYVKGKHKKATLITHGSRCNWLLKLAANRVISFEEIKHEIEKKRGLP